MRNLLKQERHQVSSLMPLNMNTNQLSRQKVNNNSLKYVFSLSVQPFFFQASWCSFLKIVANDLRRTLMKDKFFKKFLFFKEMFMITDPLTQHNLYYRITNSIDQEINSNKTHSINNKSCNFCQQISKQISGGVAHV